MCGILGAVGDFDKQKFKESLELIKHRGPDAEGTYFNDKEKVYLGHRRLSILDLSEKGIQPMISDDENYIIIFNGEIYNYKEIKQKYNIATFSNTDTEVLLKLYQIKKYTMLDDLNGMYAFAIYDKKENKIFIARDRLGIKPLYILYKNNNLLFSSEIKSLKYLYSNELTIDKYSIYEYLVLNWIMEPDTIYKEIKVLESGNFAIFDIERKELKIKKYWNPKDYIGSRENINQKVLIEELEELFIDSINKRLIADVPVGTFLSGGIDSTFITEIIRRNKSDLSTLTVTFKEKYLKESNVENDEYYARKYVLDNKINEAIFENIEINDGMELFENLIMDLEIPMGDPAIVPMFLLSKKARENNLIVMLSGMGGDELFGGYPRMRFGKYMKYKKLFYIFSYLGLKLTKNKKLRRDFEKAYNFFTEDFPVSYINLLGYFSINKIKKDNLERTFQKIRSLYHPDFSYFENIRIIELKGFLTSHNLIYTDKMSMKASIEVRVPFLDHRIVEKVLGLSDKFFIDFYKGKKILSELTFKYVPEYIINRKKAGFMMPIISWLKDSNLNKYFYFNIINNKKLLSFLDKSLIENTFNNSNIDTSMQKLNLFVISKLI